MAEQYDDETLNDFLQSLDDAADVDLTTFEMDFIGDNLDTYVFTPKQRDVIYEMIEKYGKRIGWL